MGERVMVDNVMVETSGEDGENIRMHMILLRELAAGQGQLSN